MRNFRSTYRHLLFGVSAGDRRERGLKDQRPDRGQKENPRERVEREEPVRRNLNYYVEGRLFEWTIGVSTFLCGMNFWIWPESVEQSTFRLLQLLINTGGMAFMLLVIGWSRMTALMLNGQRIFGVKAGPWVRAVCCVLSAVIWTQFVVALAILSIAQEFPTPGLPFWGMFVVAELYAAYLAVKNG